MKNTILKTLLAVCLLLGLGCFPEQDQDLLKNLVFDDSILIATEYTSINPGQKTIVLEENFDDNLRNWLTGTDDDFEGELNNGIYSCYNKTKDRFIIPKITSGLNPSSNFELEARIRLTQTNPSENRGAGIYLRKGEDKHYFTIGRGKTYRVYTFEAGSYQNLTNWVDFPEIHPPSSWNKLTIRKLDDIYYYFINEKYTDFFSPALSGFGSEIGVAIEPATVLEVDWIRVVELEI